MSDENPYEAPNTTANERPKQPPDFNRAAAWAFALIAGASIIFAVGWIVAYGIAMGNADRT